MFTDFAIFGPRSNAQDPLALVIALTAMFWAMSLGSFLAALNVATKRAILDVVGNSNAGAGQVLLLTQRSVILTSQDEWAAAQVRIIRVTIDGRDTMNRYRCHLEITVTTDNNSHARTLTLLAGRDEYELHWLADTLRQALGIDYASLFDARKPAVESAKPRGS